MTKPEAANMNINWNPNVPKPGTVMRRGATLVIDGTVDEFSRVIDNEASFDSIMDNILNMPLNEVLEPRLKPLFGAQTCVVWVDEPDNGRLFSPTYELACGYFETVVGIVRATRSLMQLQNDAQSPPGYVCDPKIGDVDSKHLFFPLACNGCVKAVVEVVRTWNQAEFGEDELEAAAFLMRKFDLYGESLFKLKPCRDLALKFFNGDDIRNPTAMLGAFFKCKSVELWRRNASANQVQMWSTEERHFVDAQAEKYGIAGYALSERKVVNERLASNSEYFVTQFDGGGEGPVLAVPFEKTENETWCVVLRDRDVSFSLYDEAEVKALLPFIVKALSDVDVVVDVSPLLTKLLDVSTVLMQTLDLDELVTVLQKESAQLMGCEKAKLVMIDHEQGQLVSHIESEQGQRYPTGSGIAGASIQVGKILSVQDPDEDSRFSRGLDSDEMPNVKCIMAAPVFDVNKQIIGTLVLVNKVNGEKFDANDENVISFFNLFAGIAIHNTLKYRTNMSLSEMFMSRTTAPLPLQGDEARAEIVQLLTKGSFAHNCDRITMFTHNTDGDLIECANVGAPLVLGSQFAIKAVETGEPAYFPAQVIAAKANGKGSGSKRLGAAKAKANTKSRLFRGPGAQFQDEKKESIYCVPMIHSDGATFGVLEFHQFHSPTDSEFVRMQQFTRVFAWSLQKLQIPELSVYGFGQINATDWISEDELGSTSIPQKLVLSQRRSATALRREFNIDQWDGIAAFQLVFHVFQKHNLLDEFHFDNGHLFAFLNELKSSYNNIPFCNWRHAIDTLQFAAFVVSAVKFADAFSKTELFALFLACLCHDVGHDGFMDLVGAETAQYHLLKRHSSYEADSCIKAIAIIGKDKCNILDAVSDEQAQSLWEIIIDLITATDMAQHFDYIATFKTALEAGSMDPRKNESHKNLLRLIIKCADLSSILRAPRRQWIYAAEEFYKQGDLDQVPSLVYTTESNRRQDLDKHKSFPAFLTHVCAPLFDILGTVCPSLNWTATQIQSNVDQQPSC